MTPHTAARRASQVVAGLAVLFALVAGCADAPPDPAGGTQACDPGRADVAYAQMMIPHVAQGVELTAMVPSRTSNAELRRIVLPMDRADVEEDGQLRGWLHQQGAPVLGEAGVPMMRMTGMADPPTLDLVRTLRGEAFDRAWLDVMLAHHRGGGAMSRDYLAAGCGQALRTVARTQVEIGGAQIDQMAALRSAAGG